MFNIFHKIFIINKILVSKVGERMRKKIVGIFLCTLLIATGVVTVSGAGNVAKNQNYAEDICPYTTNGQNNPPVMHPIVGPIKVHRHQLNIWSFMATDADLDPLTIYIDWGDGTRIQSVGAISGVNVLKGHIYGLLSYSEGSCVISAFAIDMYGAKSNTVTLDVAFCSFPNVINLFLNMNK